jgi:hypothetical protein
MEAVDRTNIPGRVAAHGHLIRDQKRVSAGARRVHSRDLRTHIVEVTRAATAYDHSLEANQ